MKHDQAKLHAFSKLILLASSDSKQTDNGDPPTHEELTALIEGSLPSERKNQIYFYLNKHPALFSQWIEIVESVLDEQAQTQASEQANELGIGNLLQRFNEYVKSWFLIPSGGLAFCLILWLGYGAYQNQSFDRDHVLSLSSADYRTVSDEELLTKYESFMTYVAKNCDKFVNNEQNKALYLIILRKYEAEFRSRELDLLNRTQSIINNVETGANPICDADDTRNEK